MARGFVWWKTNDDGLEGDRMLILHHGSVLLVILEDAESSW